MLQPTHFIVARTLEFKYFQKPERNIKERALNSAQPASISYLENIFVPYGYTNGNSLLGLEMEAIPGPFVMISLLCKC